MNPWSSLLLLPLQARRDHLPRQRQEALPRHHGSLPRRHGSLPLPLGSLPLPLLLPRQRVALVLARPPPPPRHPRMPPHGLRALDVSSVPSIV
jgi:hypothetical protein